MNNYNDDYYLIRMDVDDSRIPYLKPDENSSARRFLREGPAPGSPPMVFFNADKEENIRSGIVIDTPPILFAGFNLVVRKEIRDALLLTTVANLFMHPTVYIDDKDKWHEDYWYLTFSKGIDCWDRVESDYNRGAPIPAGGEILFEVHSFRLDDKILDNIPLENRLLFMMSGAINSPIFVHQSIRSIFSAEGKCGAEVIPVSEQ